MGFLAVVAAVLAFGFLILTHEFGHYITARIFHVKINEFSVGFGPRLVSHTSKKTGIRYSLAALPLGGFVSMEGENEETHDPNALSSKPAWQRLIIMSAGAVVNLLTGFILMLVLTISLPLGSTTVAGHPASLAGNHSTEGILLKGDQILSVAGDRVHVAEELQYAIMRYGYEPVEVVVLRDGQEKTLLVEFSTEKNSGQLVGSADFQVYREEKTFPGVMKHTFYRCVSTVRMVWESVYDLITGRYTVEAVSGPVGITGAISETVGAEGVSFGDRLLLLCNFMALIAINLGIVNLFPLPALDGGRVLFLLIEVIFRKPVPQRIEGMIHAVGIIILFGLMILIAVKDVAALLI